MYFCERSVDYNTSEEAFFLAFKSKPFRTAIVTFHIQIPIYDSVQ